jgi:hypothetical protein
MAQGEENFRKTLADLRNSLTHPVPLQVDTNYIVNFARYFDAPQPVRPLLPAFTNDLIIEGTLPDPTFNGMVTGLKRSQVEQALAKSFDMKRPDVRGWVVAKGQIFLQPNNGAPVLAASDAYSFHASVKASGYGTVTSVALQLPTGVPTGMSSFDQENFSRDDSFATQAALDAAYPNGAYMLTIGTANDGTNMLWLNLGNNAYPATPRVSNFDVAQSFDPTRDFTLTWDAFTGGTTNDLVQLTINDGLTGEKIFRTPDFWQDTALNGTAHSVIIPAGTLTGSRSYEARLLFAQVAAIDRTSFPAAIGAAAYFKQTSFTLGTTDVRDYTIQKEQEFVQTNSAAPVLLASNAFSFKAMLGTVSDGPMSTVDHASLRLPNGVVKTDSYSYYGFSVYESFDTQSALDTAYPNGTYTMTINSSYKGTRSADLNLTGNAYPNAPHISNYTAAQSIDGRSDFILRWDAFTGGANQGSIQVVIYGRGRPRPILETPGYGEPGAMDGTATSVVIPHGTLYGSPQESVGNFPMKSH